MKPGEGGLFRRGRGRKAAGARSGQDGAEAENKAATMNQETKEEYLWHFIEFDNYKAQLGAFYKAPLEENGFLDLENKQQRIAEMERQMEEPTFWDDPDKSAKIMKDLKSLKSAVSRYNSLKSQFEDIETLIEMGRRRDDEELAQEAGEALGGFEGDMRTCAPRLLLSGEYDANNAIVALSAGTGGTEAMDFNEMLYRMYTRWCESTALR